MNLIKKMLNGIGDFFAHKYGETYYEICICPHCGKSFELFLLYGFESEYDYYCPYCGEEIKWY